MSENQERINLLHQKLENLLKKQEVFSREVNELREEINKLKFSPLQDATAKEAVKTPLPESAAPLLVISEKEIQPGKAVPLPGKKTSGFKTDLEKFIGENLINKIGIIILLAGVVIGSRYAIEHQLVSPLTRIVSGYIMGLGLLVFALRLKQDYKNFSAVLLSGSMAIMYFITFSAYSFYHLVPQLLAFVLMVIFTLFTVFAAMHYNRQVIAHIGLVGAYAVPFLLSAGSGNVLALFSYIAIINAGILVIAFRKYWKPLYYFSFFSTWILFLFWFLFSYTAAYFGMALAFSTIFFITFYLMFLAYKLLQKEKFGTGDIFLLLMNSFVFYGIGYNMLANHHAAEQFLGLFTLGNAMVHFMVSFIVYRQKLADRNIFFFLAGLVLVFITIAIPVQLDGNWVTLLWTGEAALLFWIGRTKHLPMYEKMSYPLMLLALFSIIHDWSMLYDSYIPGVTEARITPVFNIHFLTSLLFSGAFIFINLLHWKKKTLSPLKKKELLKLFSFSISAILLAAIYFTFYMEIAVYCRQLYADSRIQLPANEMVTARFIYNYDLDHFKSIWLINYSMLFFTILSWINFRKLKNQDLGFINLGLNMIVLAVFLSQGLYLLGELRLSYLGQPLAEYYKSGVFNIAIRYISLALVAVVLLSSFKYVRQEFMKTDLRITFDLLLFSSLLWVASSELVHWMEMARSTQTYNLGLSILWGMFSLMLIALGIWKKKKHLRLGAIALFGITLYKLFFHDISHLDTIAKTVVFVSLGILLLIISFLYNKYKHIIL